MTEVPDKIRKAAQAMAQRSVEARKSAWGEEEFLNRMRTWGKLGGRPKGAKPKAGPETSGKEADIQKRTKR